MKEGVSSLSSPPPPRLLAPFFARPLLRNSTETLATQATRRDKLLLDHSIIHLTCAQPDTCIYKTWIQQFLCRLGRPIRWLAHQGA